MARPDANDPDKERGVYHKFSARRVDFEAQQRHAHCDLFVLDLTDDAYARQAIRAYVAACRAEYPQLAADIDALLAGENGAREWSH